MIEGIRRHFIQIAVSVLSIVMIGLAVVINTANYFQVRSELEETLANLTDQEFSAPKGENPMDRRQQNALDEARYFIAVMGENRDVFISGRFRIPENTLDELKNDAREAIESGREKGRIGNYMFNVREATGNEKITVAVFLNCETKMDSVRRLIVVSAISCAGGILLAWLGMALFSSQAIRPMIQNAIQQKQFITDAGHELKTPLTVISANMDVLTMNADTNEWIEDTRKQVANMRVLVSNLIYLSRMDEYGVILQMEVVDFTGLVKTQTESFEGMADFMGKTLVPSIQEGIIIQGDSDALNRLVSQLCDNAVKYAPEGDTIQIVLRKSGYECILLSENSVAESFSEESLRHLFDRFYRPDASRSRESGGYGIGLSMARAIMERHGGKIRAEQTESGRIRFICTFPIRKGGRENCVSMKNDKWLLRK